MALAFEIVQACDAGDERLDPGWNPHFGRIREMRPAAVAVLVEFGLKRVPDLASSGAESDKSAAPRHKVDPNSLDLQPIPHSSEIARADSEPVAELFWCEPYMI